jgi:propionyl-CoA carboxylase beta chain
VAADAADALDLTRRVLGYLPSSCDDLPPAEPPSDPEPMPRVPDDHREPYDVRTVIRGVVDLGSFLELHEQFAENVVVGFARVDGRAVGVVANQPLVLAGCLDIDASEKAARFVRLCDAFGLPLVTLVDVPGFLPGTGQETGGIIRKGAKLLRPPCRAAAPLPHRGDGPERARRTAQHRRGDRPGGNPRADRSDHPVPGALRAAGLPSRQPAPVSPRRGSERNDRAAR